MRTSLAVLCALALFASLFVLAYVEAEHLLGWPDAMCHWLDAWLPLVMALGSLAITLALPWIADLFNAETGHREG